jgi:glutamyl-tRNA reductase
MASLVVVGLHQRSCPPGLRDRFALVESGLGGALEELRETGTREALLLATCDRIELWSPEDRVGQQFAPLVAARTGIAEDAIAAAAYRHVDEAALRHVFGVASALDSRAVGEPHVLGQLRAAHRAAAENGLVGAALEAALAAAYGCARRVRRDTPLGEQPATLAAAASELARGVHGDLGRTAALLIGPSEMGELMAAQFQRGGLKRLVVCGPEAHAASAAARLVSNHAPMAELADALAAADIVIAALGTGRTVLTPTLVEAALRRRPSRPMFIVDAAIPADADPAINGIDGVFLYDLADLERAAMTGRAPRAAALEAAWRIVAEELAAHQARRAARQAAPTVIALRRHFERVRQSVMAERGLDAESATRLLVNRLLHDPSEALRDLAGAERDAAALEALLRRLFRLAGEEGEA